MRFISAVFLPNSAAGEPCQTCAAKPPIIDCQCHQVPPETIENKRRENPIPIGFYVSHCKWRTVPPEGVVERFNQFVGLLTEIRSFLSEIRDNYFRRLLCHTLGSEIKHSFFPDNLSSIGPMVLGMCRFSDKSFFQFKPAINLEARP